MSEFVKITYYTPKGQKVENIFQVAPKGYHPVEMLVRKDELVQIPEKSILKKEKI